MSGADVDRDEPGLSLTAVDEVRRLSQQQTLGRRGHPDDPLYRGRRMLDRSFTALTDRQWTKLEAHPDAR